MISSIPKIHIPPKTVDPRFVRTVSGLFLPKIKKGATTHDKEENAAGRQARRRKRAAFIEKLHICMETGIEKFALCMV